MTQGFWIRESTGTGKVFVESKGWKIKKISETNKRNYFLRPQRGRGSELVFPLSQCDIFSFSALFSAWISSLDFQISIRLFHFQNFTFMVYPDHFMAVGCFAGFLSTISIILTVRFWQVLQCFPSKIFRPNVYRLDLHFLCLCPHHCLAYRYCYHLHQCFRWNLTKNSH